MQYIKHSSLTCRSNRVTLKKNYKPSFSNFLILVKVYHFGENFEGTKKRNKICDRNT